MKNMRSDTGMTSTIICELWERDTCKRGEIEEVSPSSIRVKSIEDTHQDYKKSAVYIITDRCDFKCCREAGIDVCQNMSVVHQKSIEVTYWEVLDIVTRNHPILSAIVFGGLEPLLQMNEVYWCIKFLRQHNVKDDIVIYTGYYPEELCGEDMLKIASLGNIIIKFGRFVPNSNRKRDEVLKVYLASDNQFAVKFK